MPNIPSIKIGDTTYDVKDQVARDHLVEVVDEMPDDPTEMHPDNRLVVVDQENEYTIPTIDEFNDLNSAFTLSDEKLFNALDMYWLLFQQGLWRSADGTYDPSRNDYVCTVNPIEVDGGDRIVIDNIPLDSGYVYFCRYNSNMDYIESTYQTISNGKAQYTIPSGTKFVHLAITKNNSTILTPSNFTTAIDIAKNGESICKCKMPTQIANLYDAVEGIKNDFYSTITNDTRTIYVENLIINGHKYKVTNNTNDSMSLAICNESKESIQAITAIPAKSSSEFTATVAGYYLLIYARANGDVEVVDLDSDIGRIDKSISDLQYTATGVSELQEIISDDFGYEYDGDSFVNGNQVIGTGIDYTNIQRIVSTRVIRVKNGDYVDYNIASGNSIVLNVSSDTTYKDRLQSIGWVDGAAVGRFNIAYDGYLLIICRKPNNDPLSVSDYASTIRIYNNNLSRSIGSDILNAENGYTVIRKQFYISPTFDTGVYASGMCLYEDGKILMFGVGDDAHQNYVKGFIVNIENEYTVGAFTHNFGHMNSVSYNPVTDTLLFGNGNGNYSVHPKFYLYVGLKNKIDNGITQFSFADCIEYDCTNVDGMGTETQANAVWGDNGTVVLITNDSQIIRVIQLGIGDNELENGTAAEVSEDEYNGTFKVQKKYTQITAPLGSGTGESVEYCVQGAAFSNGKVFVGVGHDRYEVWEMSTNDVTKKINTKRLIRHFYNDDGTASDLGITAVEADVNYLYVYNTNGYLQQFYRN